MNSRSTDAKSNINNDAYPIIENTISAAMEFTFFYCVHWIDVMSEEITEFLNRLTIQLSVQQRNYCFNISVTDQYHKIYKSN